MSDRRAAILTGAARGLGAATALHLAKTGWDLVLTDVVMPEGISGTDLAGQLVAENPWLKIVFMSGYTSHEMSQELLQSLNASFIAKPYGHADLVKIVRNSLDKLPAATGKAAPERTA